MSPLFQVQKFNFTATGSKIKSKKVAIAAPPSTTTVVDVAPVQGIFYLLFISSMLWSRKDPEQYTITNQFKPISQGTPKIFGPSTGPY